MSGASPEQILVAFRNATRGRELSESAWFGGYETGGDE